MSAKCFFCDSEITEKRQNEFGMCETCEAVIGLPEPKRERPTVRVAEVEREVPRRAACA